jgi:hypothetical protein
MELDNMEKKINRNVITYTDEYYNVLDAILDLDITDDERNDVATKLFKAIAAAEHVGYTGCNDASNIRGRGKLIES